MQHNPQVRNALLLVLCLSLALGAFAQQIHVVDVGPNGTAAFLDRDTGKTSFGGPVPTVIRRGDSVHWLFLYGHSSTSGSCPNFSCQANGIWDSGIKPGPSDLFPRTFTTTGVFPYFCLVHLSAMQGKIVVLEGPEFFLEVTNSSSTFPPPPVPTVNVLAGQTGTFTGTITGFLGYNHPVNLSCQNGSTRAPGTCSAASVTPDGNGGLATFNLTVSDPTPGTYTFDIVGVGTDPQRITKRQQVQLQISDLRMSAPAPETVTAIINFSSSEPATFRLESVGGFNGFVNLNCTGLPPGAFCFFNPNSLSFSSGQSHNVSMQVSPGFGPADIYSAQLQASSFFSQSSVTRTRPFTLKLLPADRLVVTSASTTAVSGSPINLTVSAVDRNGLVVNSYNQTVRFSSTDSSAGLPENQRFEPVHRGIRTFPVSLRKLGPSTVTATDLSVFATTGSSSVIFVHPASSPNNQANISSSRSPATGRDAYFRNDDVTLTVIVAALTGSAAPSGKVRLFLGTREITPAAGLNLSPLSPGQAQATFTIPHLPPGGHMITAVYDGDSNFAPSVSQPLSQPRSPAPSCVADRCPGSH
jgi:plastocyanin